MASPVGHVMVGLAAAVVAARVTGTPHSPQLWIGAFVATGIPDLDYVPALFGVRRPHMHRNASHSLFVMGAIVAGAWLALELVPYTVSSGTLWVWAVALFSHPLVDVVTTGPVTAARGYGIPLFWPFSRKRLFLPRPVLETADFDACRSVRDVWIGIRPEIIRLGPPAAGVFALALVM